METTAQQIDSIFAEFDKTNTPGCNLAVYKDGEIIYQRSYGMANLEHGIPIKRETRFQIGSISKHFTAMSIALLEKDGKLSVEDDIRKYMPEVPDFGNPITINHLIHHTSGLREHGYLSWLAGLCPLDYRTRDAVDLICRQQGANYPAGEAYLYNNAGYVLQAEIVARASGQPLPVFAKENIFEPLGMAHTHFNDDCGQLVPLRAASYEPLPEGGYRQLLMTNNVGGSAGVMTTVGDLLRWDQNFYHPVVGGEDFARQMYTRGRLHNGEPIDYSLGLMHAEVCGQPAVYHTGTEFGYRSILMRFPERNFTIICLANLSGFDSFETAEQVAGVFFGAQNGLRACLPERESLPPAPLAALESATGFYLDEDSGALVGLSSSGGQLFAEAFGASVPLSLCAHTTSGNSETLKLEYNGRLISSPLRLELERSGPQSPWTMNVWFGVTPLPLLRQVPAADPAGSELEAYTGSYYSPELKALYEFEVLDGKLVSAHLNGLTGTLHPGPAGFFTLAGFTFHFLCGDRQKIRAFRLWHLYARGIQFNRSDQNEHA